jgi:retron-type reverse transcriptase
MMKNHKTLLNKIKKIIKGKRKIINKGRKKKN